MAAFFSWWASASSTRSSGIAVSSRVPRVINPRWPASSAPFGTTPRPRARRGRSASPGSPASPASTGPGVEVATAVRPDGHVLQVTNGKGGALRRRGAGARCSRPPSSGRRSDADARHPPRPPRSSARGSATGRARPAPWPSAEVPADEAGSSRRCGSPGARRPALGGGTPILVPAQAVHCPPPGGPALGPGVLRWTSNGMGAHPDRAAGPAPRAARGGGARSAGARAAGGVHRGRDRAAAARSAEPAPRAAPRTAARVAALEARGFRVHLLDVGDVGPGPLAAARRSAAPRSG